MFLVICLKKQRHTCRNRRTHWTTQSYLVQPRHPIVNRVGYETASLLTEKVPLSSIAKNCQVLLTTVVHILKEFKSYLPKQPKKILPRVLTVDEFRSHASIEDETSFTCVDGETGELIDALPTRKSSRLVSYFLGRTNPEGVKFLVTDINVAYFQLAKRVLSNAKVVIDQFHIVGHMSQAFNELRIREMNEFRKAGQKSQAEKLKKDWCFSLESRTDINHCEYKAWKGFRAPRHPLLTEAMMIDRLLGFPPPLKEVCSFFHELVEAFQDKDPDSLFPLLVESPETLDDSSREKLQNLLVYEGGIINVMIYPYSNGKIEAKNTHVKTMKRVSYRFKLFENMRIRIFLINQLISTR